MESRRPCPLLGSAQFITLPSKMPKPMCRPICHPPVIRHVPPSTLGYKGWSKLLFLRDMIKAMLPYVQILNCQVQEMHRPSQVLCWVGSWLYLDLPGTETFCMENSPGWLPFTCLPQLTPICLGICMFLQQCTSHTACHLETSGVPISSRNSGRLEV